VLNLATFPTQWTGVIGHSVRGTSMNISCFVNHRGFLADVRLNVLQAAHLSWGPHCGTGALAGDLTAALDV